MLTISPITNNNSQCKKNVNFKSQFQSSPYLKDLLNKCIDDPKGKGYIVNHMRKIMNDGLNNVYRLDYTGSKFWDWLFKGAFKITKNGKTSPWNFNFSFGGIVNQGEFALREIAKDIEATNYAPEYEAAIIKVNNAWGELFDAYDYGDSSPKNIKRLRKKKDFVEKKRDMVIKKELISIRNEIFGPQNVTK